MTYNSHQFSSSSLTIIFFFLFFVDLRISLVDAQEDIERYNNCKDVKFVCGQQNISYPFWGGSRPDYCGHPGYKLDCEDGFVQIESMSTKYRVLNIDDRSRIMRIAYIDFLDDACPSVFSSATRNSLLFSFSGEILNLYYGCPAAISPPDRFAPYKFKCRTNSSSGENREDAYFLPPIDGMAEQVSSLFSLCYNNTQVPIMGSDIARLTSNASLLVSILRGGFELNYTSAGAANFSFCDGCFASDGQCGFDSSLNRHTCFCRNGTANSQTFCNGAPAARQADEREMNIEMFNSCRNTVKFECEDQVDIGYPFWGNNRPDYCGVSKYKLDCEDGVTHIDINSTKYRVLSIDGGNKSMKLANIEFLDDACPSKFSNATDFDPKLFSFPAVSYLKLFYGCLTAPTLPEGYVPNKFSCRNTSSSDNRNRDDAYFVLPTPSGVPDQVLRGFLFVCDMNVKVPIMKPDVDRSTIPSVVTILREGFELGYGSAEAANFTFCDRCNQSGGQCGFNTTHTCFCANGTASAQTFCSSPAPAPAPARDHNNKPRKIAIGVGAGVGGFILACLAFYFFYLRRRKNRRSISSNLISQNISPDSSLKPDPENGSAYFKTPIFSYKELEEATNNFDSNRELGDGGFGTVYRGELRDGRVVAVKRLYENNFKRVEQFMNEVNILSHLRHENLVTLYGCTSRHSRELLLVYEYVPNGTVADHIHGELAKAGLATWPVRMNIAIESAGALKYLHVSEIIHRDVKTNNILLDKSFHVKVADFGLSRLFPTDVTHVSTAPQGTPGYVDPEYYQCYQLTNKSDVYSFGVVLIELISSKPAVDITRHRHDINLANMAINKIQNHSLSDLVDPHLGFETDTRARRMITLVAELAFRCLQQDRDMRPCMDEVYEVLKGIKDEEYNVGKAEEVIDIRSDRDVVGLLKNNTAPFSPVSVTDKWGSVASTPNTSS